MKLETKLKHTPGPWKPMYITNAMDGKLIEDVPIYDGSDKLIASLEIKDQCGSELCDDVVAANARLIAAAPDMLDALMQATILLKHACDGHALESQYAVETADAMTAAITKAIGETQE